MTECDSMHSAIEYTRRHLTIYPVNEWAFVLKSPERHNPYTVKVMLTSDFKECLASKRVPNRTSAQCGTLNWLKMRHIRVKKDSPNKIFFKTDFDQKEFDYISQSKTATWAKLKLRKCVQNRLLISYANYNHVFTMPNKSKISKD